LTRRAKILLAACLPALALSQPWAAAEVTQKDGVRVAVDGSLAPRRLPRHGKAPISVDVSGRIGSTSPSGPPQLRTLQIAINREGRISSRGIPVCRLGRINPSTTKEAMAACGSSLVGEGHFSASVKLPRQSPFPSEGKILAFNGRLRGQPALLAHIYGTKPVPTSYVLPFLVRPARGTFGTTLEASLPAVTGEWGFVTGISISLHRNFTFKGRRQSFLSAGCPAPAGFGAVAFPLLRTTFGFDGGLELTESLTRTCQATG
jgi:hypothetical protein